MSISLNVGAQSVSPRSMMDQRIQLAAQSGSISETDESALETALDSIDSALSGGSASGGSTTPRLDPSDMKSRVDALISQQVSDGTLTEDQAAKLQSFFAQGAPPSGGEGGDDMVVGGTGGVGGAHHHGKCGGPPPSSDDSDDDDSSTTLTSTDQLDSIISFLENLRSSLAEGTYGSTATASDSANSGLVVDSLA